MLPWLTLAAVALAVSVWAAVRKQAQFAHAAAALGYLALAVFVLSGAGGLLGFFALGLGLLAAGELAAGWGGKAMAARAQAAVPLAAVSFALGLGVLRLHDYAYLPAAVLVAMTLAAAAQAYRRLSAGPNKKSSQPSRLWLSLYIVAVGVLLYAALYKTVDQDWFLFTSYGAATGALLFTLSQIWLGWERVLRKPVEPAWAQQTALRAGVLLMAAAAFFAYL